MTTSNHEQFIEMALEEAKKGEGEGNAPFGAIIVRDRQVVAGAHNQVTSSHDPTSHAESQAVRKAGVSLGTEDLSGSTLYTTSEPCPMCMGAIIVGKVSTLVMGGRISSERRPYGVYSVETFLDLTSSVSRLNVVTGILQEKCEKMRDDWFRQHAQR